MGATPGEKVGSGVEFPCDTTPLEPLRDAGLDQLAQLPSVGGGIALQDGPADDLGVVDIGLGRAGPAEGTAITVVVDDPAMLPAAGAFLPGPAAPAEA